MFQIYNILIEPELMIYAQKRGLEKQLKKAFRYILQGNFQAVRLERRQPKSQ